MNIFTTDHPLDREEQRESWRALQRAGAFAACLVALLVLNTVYTRRFVNHEPGFFPFLPGTPAEACLRMPWGYFANFAPVWPYLPVWTALSLPALLCRRLRTAVLYLSFTLIVLSLAWMLFLFSYGVHITPAG